MFFYYTIELECDGKFVFMEAQYMAVLTLL